MRSRLSMSCFTLALILASAAPAPSAVAAGGAVVPRTDGSSDGYYYVLGGSGEDRFISEYSEDAFDPDSIVCGLRVGMGNPGSPAPGPLVGELRLEDPGNPGFPDLSSGGLLASADAASLGPCSPSGMFRMMTFGGGAGVPSAYLSRQYACVIEPVPSPGGAYCGVLLDTNAPDLGYAKYYSGGSFGPIPWNHFVELVVAGSPRLDLRVRASGSSRSPGDGGIPVVFTTRPNTSATVTDDNITLTLSIDNQTGETISRSLRICGDQSVIDPRKGLKELTHHFRPVGGGPPVMAPIAFPSGRTVMRLEIARAYVKAYAATIVNKVALNLPFRVLVDDPSLDTDACVLDGWADVDSESTILGLRRRAGSPDDNRAEQFVTVPLSLAFGSSIEVRYRALDMPKVSYNVTGFEVVGREVGGAGLPGFDALELRREDAILVGSPDLSAAGLVRSIGAVDGIGSAPIGAGDPSTTVFNSTDIHIDPTVNPGLVSNLFLRAVFLPGASTEFVAIGVDSAPLETQLGDSSWIDSGVLPALPIQGNAMLRLLVNGDRFTLSPDGSAATAIANPVVRTVNEFVRIDRSGRVID